MPAAPRGRLSRETLGTREVSGDGVAKALEAKIHSETDPAAHHGRMILYPTHDLRGKAVPPQTGAPPALLACVDEPAGTDVIVGQSCRFSGWALSTSGQSVKVCALVGGVRKEFASNRSRRDVLDLWGSQFPGQADPCGFRFHLDLRDLGDKVGVTLEFDDGNVVARSPEFQLRPQENARPPRANYKEVWNAVSESVDDAKFAVAGYTDEAEFGRAAAATLGVLRSTVGINPDDVILEIGAGVGRVGSLLAPLCKRWIGADVSENMVAHASRRLAEHRNVETVTLNGWDLGPIPPESVNVVYCTVVFMHLDEWERFAYVREAFRVLCPGGRLYVDNVNLTSDEGWAFFLSHVEDFHPLDRPPNISKCSTPQELRAYFERAGFDEIQERADGLWISVFGKKARGGP